MAKLRESLQGTWDGLRNSPSWERDAAAITSPWRVGLWFLSLNVLIVGGLVIAFFLISNIAAIGTLNGGMRRPILFELLGLNHQAPEAVASIGLGRLFFGSIFLSLIFFLTVFVPIRVFGIFLVPRIGRYFDQIVLSGITPWRFLAGKIMGQQAFYLVALSVCLPYFFLCVSFGGVSFGEVLLCAVMIFVYVHVLVIVTLAAAMVCSEIVALPLVIGVFLASAAFGFAPVSPNPANLTPVASIVGMFQQDLLSQSGSPTMSGLFQGGIGALTLVQSHVLLYFFVSFAILTLGGLAIILGPINSLSLGLNTFGEAVLRGDSKRPSWIKRRFNLRRQSELSFLYENGSPHWRAADFRRRWFLRETVFLLLVGPALIWLLWLVATGYHGRMYYPLNMLLGIAAFFLNAVLFSDNWASERLVANRWEAGHLNLCHFTINLFVIWLGFGWVPYHWELDPSPRISTQIVALGHLEIHERNLIVFNLFAVIACTYYSLARTLQFHQRTKFTRLTLSGFWIILVSFVAGWLQTLFNASLPPEAPIRFPWLSMGSPMTMVERVMEGRSHTTQMVEKGIIWCAVLYASIALVSFVMGQRRRSQLPQRNL